MSTRRQGKHRQKKKHPAVAAAPTSARSRSRALAVIDEAPIRAEAMGTYLRLETEIGELRLVLDAFETGDLPAHQRWEARAFGALLTEIRNLTTELQQKDMICRAVQEEMTWTGCTAVTAYRRVMKALNEPPPPEAQWGRGDADERDSFDDGGDPFDAAGPDA